MERNNKLLLGRLLTHFICVTCQISVTKKSMPGTLHYHDAMSLMFNIKFCIKRADPTSSIQLKISSDAC